MPTAQKFGNTLADMPVAIVNLRTVVMGVRSSSTLPHASGEAPQARRRRSRAAPFTSAALARHADLRSATSSRPA